MNWSFYQQISSPSVTSEIEWEVVKGEDSESTSPYVLEVSRPIKVALQGPSTSESRSL